MIERYFKNLYQRTMTEAYSLAHDKIAQELAGSSGDCLDCGANNGLKYTKLSEMIGLEKGQYHGIEWNENLVEEARKKNLNVIRGDLNKNINFPDETFKCIFGLSVIEHLLNPCLYLREAYRCLDKGGSLIILTPNISTFFTMALLLVGEMPSSGPHPDSDALLKKEELFKVSHDSLQFDTEMDTPVHRHLVVFSYRALKSYLKMVGFEEIQGHGFGLYPFPNTLQPILERVDPYHCHQMVFIARKSLA